MDAIYGLIQIYVDHHKDIIMPYKDIIMSL